MDYTQKVNQNKRRQESNKSSGSGFSSTLPNGIKLKFTKETYKDIWLNNGELQ